MYFTFHRQTGQYGTAASVEILASIPPPSTLDWPAAASWMDIKVKRLVLDFGNRPRQELVQRIQVFQPPVIVPLAAPSDTYRAPRKQVTRSASFCSFRVFVCVPALEPKKIL
jgi:hypothetical protein